MGAKLATNASYPYKSGDSKVPGTCGVASPTTQSLSYVTYQENLGGNETRLKELVNISPVGVAVVVNSTDFFFYKTGVLLDTSPLAVSKNCSLVNHGS